MNFSLLGKKQTKIHIVLMKKTILDKQVSRKGFLQTLGSLALALGLGGFVNLFSSETKSTKTSKSGGYGRGGYGV
jgi:hypothetical protein